MIGIIATGYGRNLFEISFDAPTVTEIKAHARGARAFFPNAQTVLDIGGQDSKAIALFENGKVRKFEMNDRCAAGTGKFLEVMATALGLTIDAFGHGSPDGRPRTLPFPACARFSPNPKLPRLIAKGPGPAARLPGVCTPASFAVPSA